MKLANSDGKKLPLTMPIIHADLWALSEGLCIFMMSLNLWDLALDKKRKSKTKSFSLARERKSAGFPPRTNHSRDVVKHL